MMKTDVEGWESQVLWGGRDFLCRPDTPIFQIEFTDEAGRSAGMSCQSLYRKLEGLGYRMFTYESKTKKLITGPLRDSDPYLNLFAVKDPEKVHAEIK